MIRRLLGRWIPYTEVVCEEPPIVIYYSRAFLERVKERYVDFQIGKKSFGSVMQKNLSQEIGWPYVETPVIRFYR